MFFSYFYDAMRDEYRRWRDGPPAPSTVSATSASPAPTPTPSDLPAVKNWSHPFGDTSSVFQQLATLAKAQSGYFPLGRNGLWHGGVHFDSGTAGTAGPQGQSFVRCLADGEVIAYRIPEQTPKTTFFPAPGVIMKAPFATGFVLVRHRLEAPKIEGIADTPPSLIFYSLYMHLADWASYLTDPEKPRPAFWSESNQYRVKTDTDFSPVRAGERGLNLRHAPTQGKTIGFLPQGTAITVSGEGAYRKVEGIKGPVKLQNPDGTLQGYVGFSALLDLGGGAYRVNTTRDALRVRPTPDTSRDKIFELPSGTEITISGEGDFRKLESVVQYVHLASLEGERVPERGKVVVLDRPRPIKAGDLIGHLGPYQESNEEAPHERLHLEVFACENVEAFFARSRQWADQMPEKARTWLKLEKGTKVVVYQPGHSHSAPPNLGDPHVASGAKLLIPRTELDGLSADRKIAVPATETSKARNWYRLDDLLIDAAGKDIPMGWICDEVGVTPWVNPWSWDGYEVIYNDDPPQNALAHFLLNMGDYFDGKEMEQWKPLADASDKGPVRERLFEIIDADRDGKITTDEIQKALKVPAYAQSISQLVIHYESEWFYQQRKWDALDKVLGHTGSTPILNWVPEKERIKESSWFESLSARAVLPARGNAFHIHPIYFMHAVNQKAKCSCGCCSDVRFSRYKWVRERTGYPDREYFGPVYKGTKRLSDFLGWNSLIAKEKATIDERDIVIAMSSNEGALDAVQAWDWQTLSAGAMQKTVTPDGFGEFPAQVGDFSKEHSVLYEELFLNCGWSVIDEGGKWRIYYSSSEVGEHAITGVELYDFIKKGFQELDSGFPKKSDALSAIVHAVINEEFQVRQVIDFIARMRSALSKRPEGYSNSARDFFLTKLGRALVLDHDVNAPGNVRRDLKRAVDRLRQIHNGLSPDPGNWGSNRLLLEQELISIYGPLRSMNSALSRYNYLRSVL